MASRFMETLFGSPSQTGQLSGFNPQNQGQFDDVISQILGRYQSGDLGSFEPIADKARSDFQTRTLPSIFERLTSLGAGGGRSSASLNVPAQAAADFDLGLNAQRAQFGQNQQQLFQNLLGLGKQEPFFKPSTPGLIEKILSGLAGAGGQALGGYLGGPAFAFKNNPELFKMLSNRGGQG